MISEILVITLLLILNAFFALSEFAIVFSDKAKLKQLAKNNKGARTALKLAEESGKFLSTIQIGITLIGILAGAYGGTTIAENIEPYFNSPHREIVSVVIVVVIITYFSVVIGEILPKRIALTNPEKIAVRIARPMYLILKIFLPLVWLLEFSSDILMKIFGVSKKR
ncbi:MAG: CNNM domain-containing protein [Pseudomonadota bacterium]